MAELCGREHLHVDLPATAFCHALGEAHGGDVDGVLCGHLVGDAQRHVGGRRRFAAGYREER